MLAEFAAYLSKLFPRPLAPTMRSRAPEPPEELPPDWWEWHNPSVQAWDHKGNRLYFAEPGTRQDPITLMGIK